MRGSSKSCFERPSTGLLFDVPEKPRANKFTASQLFRKAWGVAAGEKNLPKRGGRPGPRGPTVRGITLLAFKRLLAKIGSVENSRSGFLQKARKKKGGGSFR